MNYFRNKPLGYWLAPLAAQDAGPRQDHAIRHELRRARFLRRQIRGAHGRYGVCRQGAAGEPVEVESGAQGRVRHCAREEGDGCQWANHWHAQDTVCSSHWVTIVSSAGVYISKHCRYSGHGMFESLIVVSSAQCVHKQALPICSGQIMFIRCALPLTHTHTRPSTPLKSLVYTVRVSFQAQSPLTLSSEVLHAEPPLSASLKSHNPHRALPHSVPHNCVTHIAPSRTHPGDIAFPR